MGSLKSRTSSTRCRYAACFALGFVVASLVLAAMFWIIWCYMGLTIVQISDTQRRGLVSYSYTTPKTPTTSSPVNHTEVDGALESSLNAISKSPVTPPSQPRRRSDSSADLAKGDFAARTQVNASLNSTRRESVTSSSLERKASILHKGEEDVLHPRKVSTSNTENSAQEKSFPEIKPTQTYAPAHSDPLPTAPEDEKRPISRDSDQKVQSSRPSYRDPEFEREPLPLRRSEPGRRRYDDDDDYSDRGSPSRYDKRDRGRDTDDRYSKGDTRVYPDERPRLDDKYPPRDSDRRRGDDRDREDRYRDRDDRYRDYDDRYRDRDDRYRYRDELLRDDDKYRDDKRYLGDDRDRKREDRLEYDDKYRSRDDRYREDDRFPPRERYPDDDDRLKDRPYDERRDRYMPRDDEERYTRSRDKDYREPIMSSRTDIPSDRKSGRPNDARRPSNDDAPIRDRPRTSFNDESRTIDRYPNRDDEYLRPTKYDDRDIISATRTRDESYISRSTAPLSRSRDVAYKPSIIDERRRDDDRYSSSRDRPKYYDDDNRRVDESRYISPSSVPEADSTRRDVNRDGYRTRLPDDRKLDDVGLERRSYSAEEEEEYRRQNSRTRYYDDPDRKLPADSRRDYRTDDDYPRRTRTDDDDYPRRTRTDDDDYPRRTRTDDDDYPRRTRTGEDDYPKRTRTEDDEYRRSRPRGDYDTDRSRGSDRYDRPIDDDRPSRRYDEPRRSEVGIGLRKESYPSDVVDEDRTLLRRPEGRPPAKDRRYDDDDLPARRPAYDDTIEDRPLRPAVDRDSVDGRRRYKDDVPSTPGDSPRNVPLRSEKRESFIGSSTSPRDVVVREKRYHSSGRPYDDYEDEEERPINAKDVIEAALKHSDAQNQNPRKVSYPVFDPRVSNLTATDFIPPSDRRGTTVMSRRRRSAAYRYFMQIR